MTDTEVALSGSTAGAGGDTEIDLYADVVENDLETGPGDDYITNDDHLAQDGDLYDDVITTQSSVTDFTDITNTVNQNNVRLEQSNGLVTSGNTLSSGYNGKRVSLYIGQLTWWTTDTDLADTIHELGITDLLEVKFHENRVNGQSKGFAAVTVGSEASSRILLEKMPKREIHGQNPTVLPCNKQSLSFFEGATRKDGPMDSMPPMVAPPHRPMMRPPIGLPLPMPRGGPMDGPYRFSHQGPVILPGGPPGMARPPMQITLGPRGPVPGGPMVLGRMPGAPPPGVHPSQPVLVMQRPGGPPGANGPPLVRQQIPPGGHGVPVSSSSMAVMSGQHQPGYYPGQPGQGPPPHGVPGQQHPDPYYRGVDARSDPANMLPISEAEFQEIMERNKTVSSSAIARAVQDASAGDFGTAIETLVTAVSLIKQSKIANDDRCKILISSLQDTLKGIEDKSYGQRTRHRSRSGSPRESSRKKHRHRSRSPRDRNEYRRSEDYDGKYSRDHRRR
jgi:cleavage and polyadenylation specificity factor subunit 6/7